MTFINSWFYSNWYSPLDYNEKFRKFFFNKNFKMKLNCDWIVTKEANVNNYVK